MPSMGDPRPDIYHAAPTAMKNVQIGGTTVLNGQKPVASTNVQVNEVSQPNSITGDDGATTTEQSHMDDAVDRFAKIASKLGSAANAKAFFDAYGTDGFAPSKKPPIANDQSPDVAKELVKGFNIDNSLRDNRFNDLQLPNKPSSYGASYLETDWKIDKVNEIDNPTTLDEKAWDIIADSNKFYNGFVVAKNGTLRRARFSAFELKAGPETPHPMSAKYRPHFEVFDASSISIKETNSELERSMAQNGFSSLAIQSSASAGFLGIAAAAGAGVNKESQSSTNRGDFQEYKEYTASYNFPRARVFVDDLNLQPTQRCREALDAVRDAANALDVDDEEQKSNALEKALHLRDKFFGKFGHIFATCFQLGGQLTATKSASSFAMNEDSQVRDALKLSAALSVDAKWAGASSGISKESGTTEQTHTSSVSSVSALAWSARGGNTLLTINPGEWANSLSSYQTWRTIEQDDVHPVLELVAKMSDAATPDEFPWSTVHESFQKINQLAFQNKKKNSWSWTGKIKLRTPEGGKLVLKDNKLCLVFERHVEDEVVFTVLDADLKKKDVAKPTMRELYAGRPLFLVTGDDYARELAEDGGQIAGLWVDERGYVKSEADMGRKICRWAIHAKDPVVDFNTAWNPNSTRIVQGTEVELYCLSSRCGSYVTVEDPAPWFAPCIMKKSGEPSLRVMKIDSSCFIGINKTQVGDWTGTWDWPAKDTDFNFTRNKDSHIQELMDQYDLGNKPSEDLTELDMYRRFFGGANAENRKHLTEFMSKVDVHQTSLSFTTAANKPGKDELLEAALTGAITGAMNKWSVDTKYDQKVVFKIYFV